MTLQELLSRLIAFPVLGGESNTSILLWIKDHIESHGVATVWVPNATGDKASLHCRIGPAVDGGLILSAHTDVVPVKGQDWDSDPFELTDIGDGKWYGRGSCDMKGFLACCLAVLPDLVKAPLKRPIYFAFSYDEEIGCLGAPELITHLQNYYSETPKYALIGEPSLLQPIIGHKGIGLYTTTVNGSAGHSSSIRKEVSAIHEAARLVLWLEEKMNALASESVDERFSPPHSSLHIGLIQGGIAPNVIADKATFSWDVRVIPKDKLADIIADFETHCRQRERELQSLFSGFKIQTKEWHAPVPPLDTHKEQDIVKLLQNINPNSVLGTVPYAAEAGQYAAAGIESIICGPGSIDQAHRPNEFVERSELDKCILLLQNLCHEFSKNQ